MLQSLQFLHGNDISVLKIAQLALIGKYAVKIKDPIRETTQWLIIDLSYIIFLCVFIRPLRILVKDPIDDRNGPASGAPYPPMGGGFPQAPPHAGYGGNEYEICCAKR